MPVTLAQAKLNTQDDLDAMVIDEFQKSSAILDALIFHDAVSPMGGGSTLTYGYHRVVTQRSAAFRAVNSEYVPQEATKARYTVDLKPLGGSFQIDRVLAAAAHGAEVSFQLQQLVKATTTRFGDEVINGDTAVDANGFDGLSKALAGSTTEVSGGTTIDWTNLDSSGFQNALDVLDTFLSVLDGPPTMLLGNRLLMAKLWAIARRANSNVERPVDGLLGAAGGAPIMRQFYGAGGPVLIDPGPKSGSNVDIVPIYDPDAATFTVTQNGVPTGGTFSLRVNVGSQGEQETGAIAQAATAATVDTAIEALSTVGTGTVTVTGSAGGPYTVNFGATRDVTLIAGDNNLTGGTTPSITVAETGGTGGLTDLYAVRVGMDGFHGIVPAGQPMVRTWLPDFERAGAVKTGETEMGPVAVALKATRSAAVLRNIKIR